MCNYLMLIDFFNVYIFVKKGKIYKLKEKVGKIYVIVKYVNLLMLVWNYYFVLL